MFYAFCFHSRLFLCLSSRCPKNGLAGAEGLRVLGPKISGLDFSDDPDLGFPPLGMIMSFLLFVYCSGSREREVEHSAAEQHFIHMLLCRDSKDVRQASCCLKSAFFTFYNN